MELVTPRGWRRDEETARQRLRRWWGDLEYTFPIIDHLEVDDHGFVLRYAAIHWGRPRVDASNVPIAARWLVELVDVYQLLIADVPEDVDVFCAPLVHIDLDDHLRIAFGPYAKTNVRCDERALIRLVGELFGGLVSNIAGSPFDAIHRKCVDENATNRWRSLTQVIAAVEKLGVSADQLRGRPHLDAWRAVEEGIGWLQLGYLDRAMVRFEKGLASPHYEPLARWGLEQTGSRPPLPRARRTWQPATDDDRPHDPIRTQAERLELARQALHAGDTGYAGMLALEALANHPHDAEAMGIVAQAHLRNRHYERALKQIEKMPEGGNAHYLRGKALLGMGRHIEARDAFDRALALDPKLIEAMLLRREVDRLLRLHRRQAGEQKDSALEIPETLAELRQILVTGDVAQAIASLSAPPYREQPDAQLLLARLLAFAGEPERALGIFDQAAVSEAHRFAALLGKANVLLDLDRGEGAALAIFDVLCAERYSDADVSEGRARALEKLGRLGEAAAEFRRFISLATGGSDLRVRAAADWLRDHPL